MVSTGKLAVISVLAILGLGSLGGGWYAGNYVDNALEEGIEDSLVLDPNFIIDDPEGYAEWLTNEDDDDPPKYKRYYFWNLTNPNEYLTGSTPVYEEIGPYSYRQYDIKINEQITSTTVRYQTYTYYVFDTAESFTGASVDDKIVNVNPAYLGVVGKAGSEQALAIGFVGPTVSSILDGLAGDFTDGVKVQATAGGIAEVMKGLTVDFVANLPFTATSSGLGQIIDGLTGDFAQGVVLEGMPTVLEGVQAQVTSEIHTAVNATATTGLLHATWAAIAAGDVNVANDHLFNSLTFKADYGTPFLSTSQYITSNTTSLSYTNDTITKFLWNGSTALNIPGFFTDLATGAGTITFLKTYEAALTTPGLNATLLSEYGVTQGQLDAVVGWLTLHLISNNVGVEGAYQFQNSGETTLEGAQRRFYEQWTNSTVAPPLDLDGGKTTFELGNTGISATAAQVMWDHTHALGLSNASGLMTWVGVALQDQTALDAVAGLGLNSTQTTAILAWFGQFKDGLTTDQVLAQLAGTVDPGIANLDDVGYFHWVNGALTGDISISEKSASIPVPVEYWNITDSTLSLANARALVSGSGTMNLTDATGLGAFLTYVDLAQTGDVTAMGTLNTLFGTTLVAGEFGGLNAYLTTFLMNGFVLGQLPVDSYAKAGHYHWGDGDITGNVSLADLDPSVVIPIEYWNITSSSLSYDNSLNLTSGLWNLTDTTSVGAFFKYAANASAGDAVALATINGLFETTLTAADVINLLVYLDYVLEKLVVPTFGGVTSSDFAYLHWGSPHVTGGKSVHGDLNTTTSTLPGYPEFWAWSANVSSLGLDYSFNLTNSKALLDSLQDSELVGLVLLSVDAVNSTNTALSAGALANVNAALGSKLSKTDFLMLAGYLQYLFQKFVVEFTLMPIFAADGDLITDRTVNEWLYEYDDPLLAFLVENGLFESAASNLVNNHVSPSDPRISPAHTFKTGGDDINNVMQYVLWQEQAVIPSRTSDPVNGVWKHAEEVLGTDATQFHPGVEEDELLDAWVSELMRTIQLEFSENVKTEGIDLLRFVVADNVLAVDAAFDQSTKGVANMTVDAGGAPLFISKPHFLDTDGTASSVSGLSPDRELHDLYVDVEPTTGAVMNAAKRLQFNFQVGPGNLFTPGIAATDLLPLVWVEEGGKITQDLAEDFKDVVYQAQQIQQIAPIGGAAVGVVLILTSMFIAIRARKP